jgi:hypothetical protein
LPDIYINKGVRLMNTPGLLKCGGAIAALAMVSACGSGSTLSPSGASVAPAAATSTLKATYVGKTLFVNGRPVTAARLNPVPSISELAPDAKKGPDYEYVFNEYGTYGSMFNYPKNINMIGQLNGAGGQGCTNVLFGYGNKIMWNAGRTNDEVTEYSVPSNKVLKTLSLPYTYTSSCAMNTNGDIAIGILLGNSYGAAGQQVIFTKATGKGKVYSTPLYKAYFAGYDPSGNLFADGFDQSYTDILVELPKGAKKGVAITTSNTMGFPGSVQWDGKYISVFDQYASAAYQYTISGTKATLVNTVQLSGASDCAQTWIVKGLIYCADAGNNNGAVYKYPAGGPAVATFSGSFVEPLGVVAAHK